MIAATEETLIAQTLAGNTRAFDHLVERHRSWIQRRVLASTRQNEEAEDVVQEVFCRAFEQLSHLRQPEHFGPWLASIATRITTSHWRRQECWQRISTQIRYRETPGPTQPDELCEKRELEETLRRLLIEMPERYRRPLQLYYFERASQNEIAALSGLSLAWVKYRVGKGRHYLYNRLTRMESRYANA